MNHLLYSLLSVSHQLLQAPSEDAVGYAPPVAPAPPDLGPILVRLAAMTGLVLLILGGLALWIWLWRRPVSVTEDRGLLRSLHQIWLGRRCCLQLVEVEGCRVLIAVDPGGIKSVHPVSGDFASLLPGDEPRHQSGPSVEEIMSLLAASRNAA